MPMSNARLATLQPFLRVVRPYARAVAAFLAGLAITFIQDHSFAIGLAGMLFVVAASLLVHDGPKTLFNAVTWYLSLIVFLLGLVGLALGKMSPSATLSLIMALAAFETGLALARSDRLWAWTTAGFVAVLSVVYFSVPNDSPLPAGLTGAWGIIAGVFEIIAVFDMHVRFARTKVGGTMTSAAKAGARATAKAGVAAAKTTAKATVAAAKTTATATARGAEATKRGAERLGKATKRGTKR
jgi:hypothetical protein